MREHGKGGRAMTAGAGPGGERRAERNKRLYNLLRLLRGLRQLSYNETAVYDAIVGGLDEANDELARLLEHAQANADETVTLRASLAEVERERDVREDLVVHAAQRVVELVQRVDALAVGLRKYGRHFKNCGAWHSTMCDCGLARVLEGKA